MDEESVMETWIKSLCERGLFLPRYVANDCMSFSHFLVVLLFCHCTVLQSIIYSEIMETERSPKGDNAVPSRPSFTFFPAFACQMKTKYPLSKGLSTFNLAFTLWGREKNSVNLWQKKKDRVMSVPSRHYASLTQTFVCDIVPVIENTIMGKMLRAMTPNHSEKWESLSQLILLLCFRRTENEMRGNKRRNSFESWWGEDESASISKERCSFHWKGKRKQWSAFVFGDAWDVSHRVSISSHHEKASYNHTMMISFVLTQVWHTALLPPK